DDESHQHVLQIAADHVELAHRPVDHAHDRVDERDPESHEGVEHADHDSGDRGLDDEVGREHPSGTVRSDYFFTYCSTTSASFQSWLGLVYWRIRTGGTQLCQ